MRFRILLLTLFISLFAKAADAPKSNISRVVVSRYTSEPLRRDGAIQVDWFPKEKTWVQSNQVGFYTFTNSDCQTLLVEQRRYALNKMRERGILTAEEVEEYAHLAINLIPEQIMFFEALGPIVKREHALNIRYPQNEIKGTLWNVSGQKVDEHGQYVPTELSCLLFPCIQ